MTDDRVSKSQERPIAPETWSMLAASGFVAVYDPGGELHFMAADLWQAGCDRGDFEGWHRRQ